MPRSRPDPRVAGARLAALVPVPAADGWVPPPLEELEQPEVEPPAEERSWAPAAAAPSPGGLLGSLVPAGLRGGRWDPGRSGLTALAAVAVLAALVAGIVVLRGRPHEVAPPAFVTASPEQGAGGPEVVVDVAGKVRHPGIVRLPFGARVDDAVRAAGGPLPGASFEGLNRARKVADGEQVLVGVPAASGTAGPGADGRVDINTADASALDALPGIGPVLAQKIVDWRTEHGRFASIDQLREVGGIGESKYAALKNKVRT